MLDDARMQLNELLGTDAMDTVRLAVENADRAIKSMKFLKPDLDRRGRDDLSLKIKVAEDRLTRTMEHVRVRFLIGSEMAQKDFDEIINSLDEMAASVRVMMAAAQVEIDPDDEVAGFYTCKPIQYNDEDFYTLRLEGTMNKLDFEFIAVSPGGDVTVHLKGTLTGGVYAGETDGVKWSQLNSVSTDQLADRLVNASLMIELGSDGKWRPGNFSLATRSWALIKQDGEVLVLPLPAARAA